MPADHKWYTRLVVCDVLCDALEGLDLRQPTVPAAVRKTWEQAKRELETEKEAG